MDGDDNKNHGKPSLTAFNLLETKRYSKITVQDIIDGNVGKYVYAHFETKR